MELKHIEYLLQVAKEGSLSKAAKALYISQPNLSIALKEIEHELNIQIFNRTNRGITPTKQGQELIDSLSAIYQQLDFLLLKYKTAAPDTSKMYLLHNELFSLADSFYEFKLANNLPELSCEIRSDNLMSVLDNVAAASTASMGIIAIPMLDFQAYKQIISAKGLTFSPLFRTHSYLIVGPKHPFFEKGSVTLDDLSDCELIFYSTSHLIQSSKFIRHFNSRKIRFVLNSKDPVLSLISESQMCGVGSAFLESSIFINSPSLKYIPIDNEKADLLFGTVKNPDFVLDEKYELFVNSLEKNYAKNYKY